MESLDNKWILKGDSEGEADDHCKEWSLSKQGGGGFCVHSADWGCSGILYLS